MGKFIKTSYFGDWRKLGSFQHALNLEAPKLKTKIMKQIGEFLSGKVKERVKNQDFRGVKVRPLNKGTLRTKNSKKILIRTARMINAVTYEFNQRNGLLFVGIPDSKPSIAKIAFIQEFGAIIKKTPKIIKKLAAMGFFDGLPKEYKSNNFKYFKIPARPIITDILMQEKENLQPILKNGIEEFLKKVTND